MTRTCVLGFGDSKQKLYYTASASVMTGPACLKCRKWSRFFAREEPGKPLALADSLALHGAGPGAAVTTAACPFAPCEERGIAGARSATEAATGTEWALG